MQIDRLTLTQIRAFEQEEFQFQPGMNLIVGINGIGKSTILDAIRFLLSKALPEISAARKEPKDSLNFNKEDITFGSKWLRAELRFSVRETQFEYEVRYWQDEDTASESEDVGGQTMDERIKVERLAIINSNSGLPQPLQKSFQRRLKASTEQPLAIYFSPQRSFPNSDEPSKSVKAGGGSAAFIDALDRRELRLLEFAWWWLAQKKLATESARAQRNLDMLENAVTHFLDTCAHLHADQEETDYVHEDRAGNRRIRRETKTSLLLNKAGATLNVHQLSDGERGTLVLVLDLARRLLQANSELPDPLRDGKAVVLIDELDLHLHPRWQRTIVPKLVEIFPACQFIATTHSPFIIQSLQHGNLINLHPESFAEEYSDKSIEDITEGVMGIPMPQKSERYQQMMEVAEEYYRTLARAKSENDPNLEEIKKRLDELSIPFSDDPAFTAFLKFQRENELREQ